MPPNATSHAQITGVLDEQDVETIDGGLQSGTGLKQADDRKLVLVWRNIILFAYVHLAALYGAWLMITSAMWSTSIFGNLFTLVEKYMQQVLFIHNFLFSFLSVYLIAIILYAVGGLGITGGAHRLWAHRSYKARLPLRVLLTVFNTIAFEDCAIHWARDHRVHHKYSETDADPHNATRGFFFSHVGWLLCKKHPEVIEKGKKIDISDLENDPVLAFQRK